MHTFVFHVFLSRTQKLIAIEYIYIHVLYRFSLSIMILVVAKKKNLVSEKIYFYLFLCMYKRIIINSTILTESKKKREESIVFVSP